MIRNFVFLNGRELRGRLPKIDFRNVQNLCMFSNPKILETIMSANFDLHCNIVRFVQVLIWHC